jgi:NAD(P)-dependent dehydrogenase (short-subunit alcohol dehydrogenase family)
VCPRYTKNSGPKHILDVEINVGTYLKDKVAIITGSGRGIGRAEALAFATEGAKVVVNDPGVDSDGTGGSTSPADEVVAEIKSLGGEAVANYDSVDEYDSAGTLIATALEAFGRLDILVNNASIFNNSAFVDITLEEWNRMMAVDLNGVFYTCKHAVPVMIEQGYGRIINTTSSQWRNPEGRVAYAAAKGAVVSLTWDLAWELRDYGITVNAMAPMAATRAWDAAATRERAAGASNGRMSAYEVSRGSPEFVAPMVVYLASDLAFNINGRVFRVGSGKIGMYSHPTEMISVFKDHTTQGPWTIEELETILPGTVLARDTKAPHIP